MSASADWSSSRVCGAHVATFVCYEGEQTHRNNIPAQNMTGPAWKDATSFPTQ